MSEYTWNKKNITFTCLSSFYNPFNPYFNGVILPNDVKMGDLAKRQRGDKGHIVGVYGKGGSNLLHTMNRLHRKISFYQQLISKFLFKQFIWFNIMSYHWCQLQCNLLNSWDILYFFIFLFLSSLNFAPAVWQSLFSTSAALTKLQDCCTSDSNLCPLSEHHLK